jgi:hypothetical protein
VHKTLLGLFIVSDCTSVSEHLCHCVKLWCLVDMDSMGMSVGQRTLLERHECVSPFVHRRIHPQRVRDNRRHALAPPHAPEAVRYTNLMRWFISRQALPCTNHRRGRCFLSTQESLVASTSGQESRRRLGEGIRSDFPILHQTVHGDKQLIYFDNGATSQKPKQVLEALRAYNEGYNANVHRGVHYLAAKVRKAVVMVS